MLKKAVTLLILTAVCIHANAQGWKFDPRVGGIQEKMARPSNRAGFLFQGRLINLEKAVAVTRTPRAEPISLAETRRRGEFESYAGCFMKISLHPIGEGDPF